MAGDPVRSGQGFEVAIFPGLHSIEDCSFEAGIDCHVGLGQHLERLGSAVPGEQGISPKTDDFLGGLDAGALGCLHLLGVVRGDE